jgi:AraC-like DNA-binding protein
MRMSIVTVDRLSDSPHIESISHGYTVSDGSTIRPAEIHWHMILRKLYGRTQLLVVGPLTTSGVVSWGEGAELLWIKLKLGTFMPHLPTTNFLNIETILPEGTNNSFWLKGSTWQFPDFENVETFVDRLMREDVLVYDPLVNAALQDELPIMPSRTLRHRFLRATGLTQSHIRQMNRARQAEALLQQGVSILDTVEMAGYFDQPHLTRSLKQFIGYTPAQIIRMSQPDCRSVQDNTFDLSYHANVLTR